MAENQKSKRGSEMKVFVKVPGHDAYIDVDRIISFSQTNDDLYVVTEDSDDGEFENVKADDFGRAIIQAQEAAKS